MINTDKIDLLHDIKLKVDIADNMAVYGGSFVKALGLLILRADPINLLTIQRVFSDYIIKYHPDNWGKE